MDLKQDGFFQDTDRNINAVIQGICEKADRTDCEYVGIEMNKSREMHSYVFTNIAHLNLREFKELFGESCADVFRTQFMLLNKLNIFRGYKMVSSNPADQQIAKTLFLDPEYIERMLTISREKYDPDYDYLPKLRSLLRR